MSKFNLGDRVFDISFGWGRVCTIKPEKEFSIYVEFDLAQQERIYLDDGRFDHGHIFPQLLTKEEAKLHNFVPKIKKQYKGYVNVYDGIDSSYIHETKELADLRRDTNKKFVACVELTGEYEIIQED